MGHLEQWRSRQKQADVLKHSKGSRYCRICENPKALIRKYGLSICRQCFRENSENLGFMKQK